MTPEKAKLFVTELFEEVLPKGKVERIPEFYTPDVIGHYNNDIFTYDDLKKRCEVLGKNIKSFHFKVYNIVVIDQFVVFQSQQNWLSKKTDVLHEVRNTVIYRMRHNKICELWILHDVYSQIDAYQKVNQDFEKSMQSVAMNEKSKKIFLDRLCINQYLYSAKSIKLTHAEKECLYYYLNGYASKETAQILNISPRTVETHIMNVKNKLNCHSKIALRNCILMTKPV